MAQESTFRTAVTVVMAVLLVVRWTFALRYRKPGAIARGQGRALDTVLVRLAGLALLLPPLLYVGYPQPLGWATLNLAPAARWVGLPLTMLGLWLLAWSHSCLGEAFSTAVDLAAGQKLVTSGPYRWVRHPMYVSYYLIWPGLSLLAANWLVGGVGLVMMSLMLAWRLPREEGLMLEAYGERYLDYQRQTGALLPRWGGRDTL